MASQSGHRRVRIFKQSCYPWVVRLAALQLHCRGRLTALYAVYGSICPGSRELSPLALTFAVHSFVGLCESRREPPAAGAVAVEAPVAVEAIRLDDDMIQLDDDEDEDAYQLELL